MANKQVFNTAKDKATTKNNAGGKAYNLSDKSALATYAVTGTFNQTFYQDPSAHLKDALKLAQSVPVEFLAKVAVYSRTHGYMKDMPAFLLAVLSTRSTALFKQVFPLVIDNGKMLRNFVQIMRSGAVGRKSLGSAPKKAIQQWLEKCDDEYLFKQSVGNNPSMADVIKMVHPRPTTPSRSALYAYLMGKEYDEAALPQLSKDFEAFKKADPSLREVPDVPFQMLTAQGLSDTEWADIAKNGAWQFTRMNLNTFQRHNVFQDDKLTKMIADRLADQKLVEKARAFPYQLMVAYETASGIPQRVSNALQQAMEHAVSNIPDFGGIDVAVLVDDSGSMGAPVTGYRPGASSAVTCNKAASVVAASVIRKNPNTVVYRFNTRASKINVNPLDSIATMTKTIGSMGGGTDCACGIVALNNAKSQAKLVILLSDMESWVDVRSYHSTGVVQAWNEYKKRVPDAQLVCVNLAASTTTQITDRSDVLNVAGFSDTFFTVVADFVASKGAPDFWVKKIESAVTLVVN